MTNKLPLVELNSVSVEIPIFNSQSRSLKKSFLNLATGGKLGFSNSGQAVVKSLDDINFRLEPQDRLGIIGHNGAGKSTLLRVLGRVYSPTSGKALISGSVGSLIDISLGIDPEATGIENIFLRGALLGIKEEDIKKNLSDLIEFSQLGEYVSLPVRTYSTGMHMRLAFAVSTMIRPDILLMDEWLSVGDQDFQKRAEVRLNDLIENTRILVLASHSENLIRRVCNKVLWLEHGKVKLMGPTSEICDIYFK